MIEPVGIGAGGVEPGAVSRKRREGTEIVIGPKPPLTILKIGVEQFGRMAVGVEGLDRGEAADHLGSRRARPRRPARDQPTNRLAPLIALRFVFHDGAKPAHAFGGVNTLAARQDPLSGMKAVRSNVAECRLRVQKGDDRRDAMLRAKCDDPGSLRHRELPAGHDRAEPILAGPADSRGGAEAAVRFGF